MKLGNFALTPYIDRSESKDVVELVSSTRRAIGYSGMGFATQEVKMLAISQKKGGNAVKAIAEKCRQGGTSDYAAVISIYQVRLFAIIRHGAALSISTSH